MTKLYNKSAIKTLFCVLIFCISIKTIAQETNDPSRFLPNIIPPSPIANDLGKYGNVPVGMFTGSPNISIPLLTLKTNGIAVPLSLFYGSNGIRVDEVSSNVGLGWNLNFGGVITRTVRDRSDDLQSRIAIPDNNDLRGNQQNYVAMQFFKAAADNNADTESDMYAFNFNGNSGKFVYDKDGVPVMITNKKIIIQKTGTNNGDFLLTDTNGVKYYFTEKETTVLRSMGAGHSIPSGSITAWYLSKISSPSGSEIYLVYDNTAMEYTVSNSQTLSVSYPPVQDSYFCPSYAKAPTFSEIVSLNMDILGKRINKIYSNNANDGYITFKHYPQGINEDVSGNSKIEAITYYNLNDFIIEKINFNYLMTINQRVFLNTISFIDPKKKYSFEYINAEKFPKRLSNSQDHWGYYNGKTNTNLVPKNIPQYMFNDIEYDGADKEPDGNFAETGLLKKIIYPTKGFTEFNYESNTYWGEKTTYPEKTVLDWHREEEDLDENAIRYTITSPIDQRIRILGRINYNNGPAPPDGEDPVEGQHYTASMQVFPADILEIPVPKFYKITQFGLPSYFEPDFTFIKGVDNIFYFDAKAGKKYYLDFYKFGFHTDAQAHVSYYQTAPLVSHTNIITGGVRIRSTIDVASSNTAPIYKRYHYADRININHSSGNQGRMPLYFDLSVTRQMCSVNDGHVGCVYMDAVDLVVTSSSIISLFDTGSSNCFYKYVTVSEGGDNFENGGEIKEFIVHRDNWVDDFDAAGRPILVDHEGNGNSKIFGVLDIKSAPFTNFGWNNGLEIKSQIFKKKDGNGSFAVIVENENIYKLDPKYSKEIKEYSLRKNFTDPCPTGTQYTCTAIDINNPYHPCYQKANGTAILVPTNENLSVVEYKTKSYWFYLESSISRKYDLNGLNPIETTTMYKYDNPLHLQLTSQITKSSLAENLETKNYYPLDTAMVNEPFVNDLKEQNNIDVLLKTETLRNGIKLSEQKTEYSKDATTSSLVLPKFIYAAKFPNSHPTANRLEKKITYDKYDNKGNILQYTLENGTPISIIWGYNQTQPIAKIENATYDQAIAVYSTNDNIFRNSLPNAMVTTYTYIPLVGIKTITDPKGQVTTYDYDEFNRLKLVKDAQGNILTENQYHYKN